MRRNGQPPQCHPQRCHRRDRSPAGDVRLRGQVPGWFHPAVYPCPNPCGADRAHPPSGGNSFLAFLCDAYDEEVLGQDKNGNDDIRTVLRLHPALAPYKAAVLPLSKKLADKGREIQQELSKYFMVDYDDAGSIGKRYRREDEIGTPLCITVDFETVGDENTPADHCVTVRDRDTMEQVRIPISELRGYIEKKLEF